MAACVAVVLLLAASPARSAGRTYVFGVNPWGSPEEMRTMFRPLMDYLQEQTGITFRISISPTYDQLVADMGSGYVQLASLNSVSFLKARRKYPNIQYLVTTTKLVGDKNTDSYIGYIIVRKDSPFKKLKDLEGQRFAFVDTESNSGYKMPYALMMQMGTPPKTFFRKFFFVGDHDEVAKAVKNRCVEGGATWDNSYDINTKRYGNIFRVIKRTPPIPNDAWVTAADVPPGVAERLKQVLLSIDTKTRTANGRLVIEPEKGFPGTGWSERSPAFYEAASSLLLYEEGK